MADTLWTPWRMDYILGPKPDGCVFCTALEQGEKSHEKNLILYTTEHSFVMMNRFPYTHAHLMILPKRHISKLDDLGKEECRELFDLVVKAQSALIRALNPQGLNMGLNQGEAAGAGIKDHLHIHIVPRWNGDTNFMPMLAETRTMPEHLSETYRTLRGHFDAIDESK
ncbi:MAG: HIT domain-containing protein [Deltaproteobacteria bacterium]|nr:HIT domain-containing protein [Deltaproteobacteria bacterium]